MKTLKFFTLISLAVVGLGLSGCNTIQDAGEDVESAGQSIEDAAE